MKTEILDERKSQISQELVENAIENLMNECCIYNGIFISETFFEKMRDEDVRNNFIENLKKLS
jgi:hypothetical protein